jgi:hypothetical protein
VAVQGSQVANVPVLCGPDSSLNGIYRLLTYSGLLAVVLALGLPAGSLFGRFGSTARFLLWLFAGGLVLNVLTLHSFETGGNFAARLQAWYVLLFNGAGAQTGATPAMPARPARHGDDSGIRDSRLARYSGANYCGAAGQ